MGYGEHVPMREHAHRLLCRIVEGSTGNPEIDDAPYLLLLLPRDWGKSAAVTKCLPIQYLLRDPNTAGLIFNEKLETAGQFLESIKYAFDSNELFRSLFPELIPPSKQDTTWSGTKIKIERDTGRSESSVMVSGVGAAIAGNHPDFIIVDDMISREAAESARRGSWEIMESVNRWVHTLEALLSSGSPHKRRIVFIGTRWYHNDCYDHLKEYFGFGQEPKTWQLTIPVEDGAKQTLPVSRYGDLVVFERSVMEDGQWSWPEKYDEEKMLRMQAQDPILYSANYLNNPSSAANATFKNEWLKEFRWLDKSTISYVTPLGVKTALNLQQLDRYMIVDPGGFGKGTEDRARSAIGVLGHTPTGEHLFLDVWSEKDTYITAQKQIVAKARQYGVRKIGIEREGQQVVFIDQVRRMLREAGLVDVVVEELKTDGKVKDDRILLLETYFQRGLFYCGTGAVFSEFRTQYNQFPRSARRDILDMLAYMPKMVRPRSPVQVGDRRANERKMLYARMGRPLPSS